MCGGLKPPLVVGASQIRQGTSLLEPSTQTCLDVTVDVPGKDMTMNMLIKHTSHVDPQVGKKTGVRRSAGVTFKLQTQPNTTTSVIFTDT